MIQIESVKQFNQRAYSRVQTLSQESNRHQQLLRQLFQEQLQIDFKEFDRIVSGLKDTIKQEQDQLQQVRRMLQINSKSMGNMRKRMNVNIDENQEMLQKIAIQEKNLQQKFDQMSSKFKSLVKTQSFQQLLLVPGPSAPAQNLTFPQRVQISKLQMNLKDLQSLVDNLRVQLSSKDIVIQKLNNDAKNFSFAKLQKKSPVRQPTKAMETQLPSTHLLSNSMILRTQSDVTILMLFFKSIGLTPIDAKLLFRASENQFKAESYHKVCDGVKDTLVIACSDKGAIFGGYSPIATVSHKQQVYLHDPSFTSFLFSVTNNLLFRLKPQNAKKALSPQGNWGPRFGKGCDLAICDKCNTQDYSSSRVGVSFELPAGTPQQNARSLLMGSSQAKIREYQVYKITLL